MDLEKVMTDNEEQLSRIRAIAHHIVIIGHDGAIIYTNLDATTTRGIASLVGDVLLTMAGSAVRDIDPDDELKFMRIATKSYEIIVAAEKDFTLVATL